MTDDKYTKRADYLMEGDILVTRTSGHTVIVLNDGELAGAPAPAVTSHPTIRKGAKGTPVKAAQTLLAAWDTKALPRYGADGDFGGETDAATRSFKVGKSKKSYPPLCRGKAFSA